MKTKTRYRHPFLNEVAVNIPTLATARVICPDVQLFESECRALLAHALQNRPELRAIQGTLGELQELFMDWFKQAPPACLRHLAPKQQFVCGLTLYTETYQELAKVEQQLMKQQVRQGQTTQYWGITFGQSLKSGK